MKTISLNELEDSVVEKTIKESECVAFFERGIKTDQAERMKWYKAGFNDGVRKAAKRLVLRLIAEHVV